MGSVMHVSETFKRDWKRIVQKKKKKKKERKGKVNQRVNVYIVMEGCMFLE